jgi:hypothetical protein
VANGNAIVINGPGAHVTNSITSFNRNNGIVISGAGFLGSQIVSHHNGLNGMLFTSTAIGPVASDINVFQNNMAGIKLNGIQGGLFDSITADGNSAFGVWLRGTTGVSVFDFDASGNGLAGVYLGCPSTGPGGLWDSSCTGIPPSRGNYVANLNSTSTANGSQTYGIGIYAGSSANRVVGIAASTNTKYDGYDGNSNCANNLWFNNSFATTNHSCVH